MNRDDKDYERWHKLKSRINATQSSPLRYKEREIWWIHLGHNVRDEEDGKGSNFSRPMLLFKGFSSHLIWGVPLSTTSKRGKYYYAFDFNCKTSVALLTQMRALDTNRLISRVGMIGLDDYCNIKRAIVRIIGV